MQGTNDHSAGSIVSDYKARQLPHAVANDRNLDAVGLALLTYRNAHVGNFALNQHDIKRRFGLSKDQFYKHINVLTDLKYLYRQQPFDRTNRGRFPFAIEQIDLSVAPPGRTGYQIYGARDFDAFKGLGLKEVGYIIWFRSHNPSYKSTAPSVAKRFNVSAPTARKICESLVAGEFLFSNRNARDRNGRITKTVYWASKATKISETVVFAERNPETDRPEAVEPYSAFPDTHSYQDTQINNLTQNNNRHGETTGCMATCPPLLQYTNSNWIYELPVEIRQKCEIEPHRLIQLQNSLPDDMLWSDLREVTGSRIHQSLHCSEALDSFRHMVAIVADHELLPDSSAYEWILGFIVRRVGSKNGKWLNDPGVVGKGFVHELVDLDLRDAVVELRASDISMMLSPSLLNDQASGYLRLIGEHRDYRHTLPSLLSEGKGQPGCLKTWTDVRRYYAASMGLSEPTTRADLPCR